LTITTSLEREPYRLYIRGAVEPKPTTPQEDYPHEMGLIRTENKMVNFGKMKVSLNDETEMSLKREKKIVFYNDSDREVQVTGEMEGPEHIRLAAENVVIAPKETVEVGVVYDARGFETLGYRSDNIVILTDDPEMPAKEFYIVATLEEYFPPLSADEKAMAPRLTIDQRFQDLGNIDPGEQVTAEYTITNQGKQPLNIRQITPNCDCLSLKMDTMDIDPGESARLYVTMDSDKRTGIQQKAVSIYSNDPLNPTQMISIRTRIKG
jgi:hypothetical protein